MFHRIDVFIILSNFLGSTLEEVFVLRSKKQPFTGVSEDRCSEKNCKKNEKTL